MSSKGQKEIGFVCVVCIGIFFIGLLYYLWTIYPTQVLIFLVIAFFILISVGIGKYVQKRKLEEARKVEAERKSKFEREQIAKGLVKFVNRKGHERWGTPEQVKEWKIIDIGMRNNFADYSPREFEKFIAELFTKMGFQVELGPGVGDYGADLVAMRGTDKVAIQVKKWRVGQNVGAKDVQQALGSMWRYKANKAIIITTSDFTIHAEEQAKGAPIELWNREILYEMIERYILST